MSARWLKEKKLSQSSDCDQTVPKEVQALFDSDVDADLVPILMKIITGAGGTGAF